MSFIANLFTGGIGNVITKVGDIVDRFNLSGEEKQQFKLDVETLLQKRDSQVEQTLRAEIQSRERVLVAELQQGDNYTKRARPTVVYFGLVLIFLNYTLFPIVALRSGMDPIALELPAGFWAGWSGIVSSWVIGRSMERRGYQHKLLGWITGNGKNKNQASIL